MAKQTVEKYYLETPLSPAERGLRFDSFRPDVLCSSGCVCWITNLYANMGLLVRSGFGPVASTPTLPLVGRIVRTAFMYKSIELFDSQ
jgi:hypothetical protein